MSPIEKLIRENRETKNPYLDLGNCGLDGTEPELELLTKCEHLETLIFANEWWETNIETQDTTEYQSNNTEGRNKIISLPHCLPKSLKKIVLHGQIIADISFLKGLTNLTHLLLGNNKIKDISTLEEFVNLSYLDIQLNQTNNIPTLHKLINLTYLDLTRNNLLDVNSVQSLTKLISLRIGGNQITDIHSLQNLSKLKYLHLEYNKISNITPLAEMNHITELIIYGNQIADVCPLENFTNLTYLDARSNNISSIFCFLNMKKLKFLDIRANDINDISYLQGLSSLEILSIGRNLIKDYNVLHSLPLLKELYLTENQINSTLPFKGLKKLKSLSLNKNPIKEITLDFLDSLPNLEKLYLYKTEIENLPKEVFNKDRNVLSDVRAYLESIAKQEDRRELNEAKLIIVGVGKVGKSELVEALTEPNYAFVEGRKETKGIKIKEWHLACPREGETTDFRANIWDFAGQEIDYGTHQFFLTKNSVYVFVWENRIGEQESKFDYWLNIVSLLSQNAPILVVQNKIDQNQTEINQQEWKNAFPNIVGFFKTSCKTGEGINALREAIEKQLFALPNTREIWNKYRVAVRTVLENHEADYITRSEYLRICRQEGLKEEDAPFLAQQLHDIGVILHFADDVLLEDTVVLKTDWAIEAAYYLLDTKNVHLGRFEMRNLRTIWANPRFGEKRAFLLELIKRFELIFQFQDTQTYIVPEGLSPESPIPANLFANSPANLLRFEYHYKFMPKGILSRFICRVHQHIKGELFWKYGVVLAYEQDTQASVTLWEIDKILKIEIAGKSASKLLAIIRSHIDHIHTSLKNPPLEEMIPCYCENCQNNPKNRDVFENSYLRMCLEERDEELRCKNRTKVKIAQLLEGIEDRQAREKPLHAIIQKALACLEQATYADYFAEMDTIDLPPYLKGLYSELKMKFISEEKNWSFTQKLETFAREANQYL